MRRITIKFLRRDGFQTSVQVSSTQNGKGNIGYSKKMKIYFKVKSKENKYSSSSSGNWFFRYLAMNFNLYFKVSCKDFTNHGTKNVKNNLTCITLIVNNMCQFDCAKDCPARL